MDTAKVDQCELHSQVAVVLQNPAQWPITAHNNIRIGRLERPDHDGTALASAEHAVFHSLAVTEPRAHLATQR